MGLISIASMILRDGVPSTDACDKTSSSHKCEGKKEFQLDGSDDHSHINEVVFLGTTLIIRFTLNGVNRGILRMRVVSCPFCGEKL